VTNLMLIAISLFSLIIAISFVQGFYFTCLAVFTMGIVAILYYKQNQFVTYWVNRFF